MNVGSAHLAADLLASDFDAELLAAIEASKNEAAGQPSPAYSTNQELSAVTEASFRDSEARRRREEEEDRQLREALALSAGEPPPPTPGFVDDEDEITKAIKASEQEIEKAEQKRRERMRQEDDSDLFQAALRASRVDLGPRGISQAAKIMATGDETLGQAALLNKTNTHQGAGGRFTRTGASGPGVLNTAGGAACAKASVPVPSGTTSAKASSPQGARTSSPPKPIGSLSSTVWKRNGATSSGGGAQGATGGTRRSQSSTLRETGKVLTKAAPAQGPSSLRSPTAKESEM